MPYFDLRSEQLTHRVDPSVVVNAGENSRATARISGSVWRACAANASSPIGERMVRAQYRTATG